MRFTIALLLALAALAFTAAPAHSDRLNGCLDYRSTASRLLNQYEELPSIVLETTDGGRTEVWINKETGTWSMLHVHGRCTAGISGKGFTVVFVEPEPEGVSL